MTIVGYFKNSMQKIPEYDPGLTVNCPVCNRVLARPLMTVTLNLPNDERDFFYRAHRFCYLGLSKDDRKLIDNAVIEIIKASDYDAQAQTASQA